MGPDRFGAFPSARLLMGYIPVKSAVGDMPTTAGYEEQCLRFPALQIGIIKPRVAIALGEKAKARLRSIAPNAPNLMHPSAREFAALVTRAARLEQQAALLREILCNAPVPYSFENFLPWKY